MIEARHLRVLREVARTGSYSAAAHALGYTQPAISQQMKALERSLGTVLVARVGRVMRLTEAGETLARHAVTILAGVSAAEEEVAAIAGLRAGRVRLVSFPSGSATLVPAALARVSERHPGVRISLVEAEPPDSIALLRAGECDVALTFSYPEIDDGSDELASPEKVADLARRPLFTDPLFALLPARHPVAQRGRVRLADLAGERWIAGCASCRGQLIKACTAGGFTPDIAFATDDYVAVQSLVAAGLGVALVPGLVRVAVQHDDLVARPVVPRINRQISAFTLRGLQDVPAVNAVLDALGMAAGTLRPARVRAGAGDGGGSQAAEGPSGQLATGTRVRPPLRA
ncbi:MAG: LysR family transcriptional regulator [Carbonactinosporaceae bacterium]